MRLLKWYRLEEFSVLHADAEKPLKAWAQKIQAHDFSHFIDLKGVFPSADYVRPSVVFDILGNKYRLVARINYEESTAAIESNLTHSEYDREKWRW